MTEKELKLSGGRIASAEVKDGVLKILIEEVKEETKAKPEVLETKAVHEDVNSDQFILVPASTLSLTDKFMKHEPRSEREEEFKELLTKVIKSGVSDFYRPRLDPSFDKNGKICYRGGLKPAVGKSFNWWEKNAKEFWPERKSRLGTKSEYVAFLGILLKKLVESGWEVATAWYAVCNDSKDLGHCWNSEGALHNLESNGCREIYGFCDLANTGKLLAEDEEKGGYWLAGTDYDYYRYASPLSGTYHSCFRDDVLYNSVGWLVLS